MPLPDAVGLPRYVRADRRLNGLVGLSSALSSSSITRSASSRRLVSMTIRDVRLAADMNVDRVLRGTAIFPEEPADQSDPRVGFACLDFACVVNQQSVDRQHTRIHQLGCCRNRGKRNKIASISIIADRHTMCDEGDAARWNWRDIGSR